MFENKNKKKGISELRQDIVTGDWVIIATARGRRPDDYKQKRIKTNNEAENCPFCKDDPSQDLLIYKRDDDSWSLRVIPNKYPAVGEFGKVLRKENDGLFERMDGVGFHEVIITGDHGRPFAELRTEEIAEILDAYQDRYLTLMNKQYIKYISVFNNHGKEAGASLGHPHSQLLAIPVVSPGIGLELFGSENYYSKHGQCVYCAMIRHEKELKERVIFENEYFIALAPFASRAAFEVWVLPKEHRAYFERIGHEEKLKMAEVLRTALAKIHKGLDDPAYNFYLHTSPCDGQDYYYYHWHIEILPKTSIWAGFELATGIEISAVRPEEAADFLRKQKV